MSTPTATKQYLIEPTDPSQITSGSWMEVIGLNTFTWNYKKVGNLYFGFSGTVSSGSLPIQVGQDTGGGVVTDIKSTMDHFASILGVTVNTYYPTNTTDGADNRVSAAGGADVTCYTWSGSNYVGTLAGNINYLGVGFLSN